MEERGNWRCEFTGAECEEAAVAKPEWGMKRICGGCGAPFYDLMRDPIVCPKCGATFDPEQMVRLKRSRGAASDNRAATVASPAKAKATEEEIEDVELGEDEEDLDDDDTVLVEDDDLDDEDDLDEIVDGVGKDGADD